MVPGFRFQVAGCQLLVACCWLLVFRRKTKKFIPCYYVSLKKFLKMKSYRDLDIYKIAFALAKRVHNASLKLPNFELYEQGSQVRRSSKSIKDQIAEGYGRRRYKPEFIKFLVYSQSSSDEALSQLDMLRDLYPEISDFRELITEYENLGRKINRFIEYVDNNWKS